MAGHIRFRSMAVLLVLSLLASLSLATSANAQVPTVERLTWERLNSDTGGEPESFGGAPVMSADGSRIMVAGGSDYPDDFAVYVFDLADGEIVQVGQQIELGLGFSTDFVMAMSADGSRIAISVTSTYLLPAGEVRVFDLIDGQWVQVGQSLNGNEPNHEFGNALALSADGTHVAASAVRNQRDAIRGYVQVFTLEGDSWVQVGDDIVGDIDGRWFGTFVDISADGSQVIANGLGDTRVNELVDGGWVEVGSTELIGFITSVADSIDGPRVLTEVEEGFRVLELADGQLRQVGDDIRHGNSGIRSATLADNGSRVIVARGSQFGNQVLQVFDLEGDTWGMVRPSIRGPVDPWTVSEDIASSADGSRIVSVGGVRSQDVEFKPELLVVEELIVEFERTFCAGIPVTVDLAFGEAPTDGDDVIRGTAGYNTINGLGGDDTICGLGGDDYIEGGSGNDRIFAGAGEDIVEGGEGRDQLFGGAESDWLNGGPGADRLYGGDGEDSLFGNAGADRLHGGDGPDELFGGDGNDHLYGNLQPDFLSGGAGDDVLRGGFGRDEMYGDEGNNDGCTLTDPRGFVEERVDCETGVFRR